MNAIEGLAYGFGLALTPENLLAALLGALIGTVVGVLPGIGPIGAMALLLPMTLSLSPATALIMLAGIYYGSMYGGSTTAILINVPGEAASVATSLDGYQMARRGRAGAALSVAASGSFVAGTIGIVGLMLFAPALAQAALSFGSPEYFALALLGLIALSRISGGSLAKGLLMVVLGLVLGTVGLESVTGVRRFDFGVVALTQGIDLVPVAVGLFGVAEVLKIAERIVSLPPPIQVKLRELFPTREEWRRALPPIFRGSALGFVIGLIPGPAAVVSTFTSYGLERRLSRHPEEFGKGAIEGVAGPETANNAATSGAMVPLLALGIPFAPGTALLLAAMAIQGVQAGPLIMTQHPDVFWGVIASMYIGNVMLLILNLPLVGVWVSLLRVPQHTLTALVLLFCLVGTYSVNNSILDLGIMLAMGVLGYVLRKLNFDVAPLVLALVLGPIIEKTFRESLFLSRGDPLIFATRPISSVLLFATLLVLLFPLVARLAQAAGVGASAAPTRAEDPRSTAA